MKDPSLGVCTYDVCPEGEGRGWLNSDQRKGGCVNLVLTRGREGVQNLENLADIICASPLCVTFALEAGTKEGLAHDLRTASRCAKLGRADSTTTRSDGCGCACASWSLCFSWHAAGEMRVVLSSGKIKSTTDRVWFWGHTIAEKGREESHS